MGGVGFWVAFWALLLGVEFMNVYVRFLDLHSQVTLIYHFKASWYGGLEFGPVNMSSLQTVLQSLISSESSDKRILITEASLPSYLGLYAVFGLIALVGFCRCLFR